MTLHVLPTRTAGAAENMAVDFLLLQRYPKDDDANPRFRHYEWRRPAFTFGYAQKIAAVREQLAASGPAEEDRVTPRFDLCRRPTGGGIVDHREDWTYALVIPRGHPLEELRAAQSYRAVHEAILEALREQEVDARLQPTTEPADVVASGGAAGPDVCFKRAEISDVVHAASGAKIAGAAQKRNKHGLLFQGSIWRPAVTTRSGVAFDWEQFEAGFVNTLAAALRVPAEPTPWPEIDDEEVSGLTEQYSSPEWIEHR